jgi:hypothetical protein
MKHMTQRQLAQSVGALLLGTLAITTVQADPVASSQSVVTFENFTINWTGGAQVDVADFSSLSVSSSLLTAANMTGFPGTSSNPSSAVGAPLVAESILGTVDPAITGTPGATTTTVFNVVPLPLTGNFSASASNELGAPITSFPNSGSPVQANADLHNGSYASLETLAGSAGTSTSSQLASTYEFVSLISGTLDFNFDVGAYTSAFLTSGAAQTASSSWDINFTIVDTTGVGLPTVFNIGDAISNNAPGSGTTVTGISNAAAPGGVITTTSSSFTTAPIVAGDTYQLTATISTRAQVERVERVSVPEPTSLSLLGIGLMALGGMSRKAKKSSDRICA